MHPRRGRSRAAAADKDDATSVYRELLAEDARQADSHIEDRPLKKRRTRPPSPPRRDASLSEERRTPHLTDEELSQAQHQVVYNDSVSSDESDFEFEDVDLDMDKDTIETSADSAVNKDITIFLDEPKVTPSKDRKQRRLPSSRIEKQRRLDLHKIHICCLLTHVHRRNAWCNDSGLQTTMRRLLSKKTLMYLHPNVSDSQFQRSRSFTDGLRQASDFFRIAYKVTQRGIRRPNWSISANFHQQDQDEETERMYNRTDFFEAAKGMRGSRDTGAQLFCAVLRSAAVDTRLVCSLQTFSFNAIPPISSSTTPVKRTITQEELSTTRTLDSDNRAQGNSVELSNMAVEGEPIPIRRFGRSVGGPKDLGKAPIPKVRRKPIIDSPYPVYWVEAFDTARQEWLPVDPLVTKTVGRPTKFEPPANDSLNAMTYVIAFNDDGTAKDVTRRYAKAYNAKTRRSRVESTKGGTRWWKRTMKTFYDGDADRDQVEDAFLANREASEPMPRNVQDFKDHPRYALIRHLRHNEIIDPMKEVGKVTVSRGGEVMESIYRRQDVKLVKSSAKWYQQGRDVKVGEQPLKHAKTRRSQYQRTSSLEDSDEEDQDVGSGLYAEHQTILCIPPPVVAGKVPRNAYGNLDVYVPSMIPPGGVHISAREATKAARIVGVDYAEAVTGFQFKGKKGTAIIHGVVVAREYAAAVEEVVRGLRWLRQDDEAEKRSRVAVRLWKRFLVGLRIMARVRQYAEADEDVDVMDEVDVAENEERDMLMQGGFVPDDIMGLGCEPIHQNGSLDEMEAQTINSLDPVAGEINRRPDYDDLQIVVASPWDLGAVDAPPSMANPKFGKVKGKEKAHNGGGGLMINNNTGDDFLPDVQEDGYMGGGFVPDGGTIGGGFVLEAKESISLGGGFVREYNIDGKRLATAMSVNQDTGTGSFLEHRSLQVSVADDEGMLDSGSVEQTGTRSPDNGSMEEIQQSPATHPLSVDAGPDTQDAMMSGALGGGMKQSPVISEGDDYDDESMLSHDPEDEDAEPDWL